MNVPVELETIGNRLINSMTPWYCNTLTERWYSRKGLTGETMMDSVRAFIHEKGIMLEDYFHKYDPLRKGYVNTTDFKKVCKEIFEEILKDEEVDEIQTLYCTDDSPNCFNWPKFMHDAESGTTAQHKDTCAPKTAGKEEILKKDAHHSSEHKRDIINISKDTSIVDDDALGKQMIQLQCRSTNQEELKTTDQCHEVQLPASSSATFFMEIPENKTKPFSSSIRSKRKQFTISYETLVWIIFLVVTILCVVDHFVLKGDVVLKRGGKLPRRIWGTNIGETITNIVWAVTARMIITSQNLMFYTMMWCFPNFLTEISPRWLTIHDIRDVHFRIHRFAGIFLIAIPSLAHVLVIFLPPLIDGTALKYYPPSTFNFSSSHWNWSKIWDPAAVQGWTFNDHTGVHLTADEIYRFVLMIALFCLIFPLSRSNYLNKRSYSLSMALHSFAGILYAVDNIRKITHGLAHFFNLPMLVIWCVDRVLSIWLYRHQHGQIVQKEVIGNDEYILMYVKLDKNVRHAVGDVYFIHQQVMKSTGILPQRSHPFTTFGNLSQDSTWDIGFVMSIIEDEDQLSLPWTSWLANNEKRTSLHTWGPYRSSVSSLHHLIQESVWKQCPSHFLLFATGSGCGYILDVLSFLAYRIQPNSQSKSLTKKQANIEIFYSVRCKAFYHSLRKPIDELLKKIAEKNTATITFQFYVTSPEEQQDNIGTTVDTKIKLINGRIDFEKALKTANKRSCCYFVGRPEIAESVEKVCKRKGVRLVKDYTNGQRGEQDSKLMIKYLKISFSLIFLIITICVMVGQVTDVKSIKHFLQNHCLNKTR